MVKPPGKACEKREIVKVCVPGRSSHIADHKLVMPPSVSMVLLVRNYVRAVQLPPLDQDSDGGQISSRALDEPSCPSTEWFGLA